MLGQPTATSHQPFHDFYHFWQIEYGTKTGKVTNESFDGVHEVESLDNSMMHMKCECIEALYLVARKKYVVSCRSRKEKIGLLKKYAMRFGVREALQREGSDW